VAMIQEATKGKPQDTAPPMSTWSPVVDMLARVLDSLNSGNLIAISAAGAKPPKFQPTPRPETAYRSIEHRERMAQHEKLVDRVKQAVPRSEVADRPQDPTASVFKQ
jgi:hypothetical protein